MNLVGKIFVVLIFVMSLVFMSLAVAVYATHENWRMLVEKPGGLKSQIQDLRKERDSLTAERDKLTSQITIEKEEWTRVRGQLETAVAAKEKELAAKREEVQQLSATAEERLAALKVATTNLDKITDEVTALRKEVLTAQAERDKRFEEVVKLTDQFKNAQGEYERIREREVQLAQQVAKMRTKLSALGAHEDAPAEPATVKGKVVAVGTGDTIEVDLGTDDGIRTGLKLEVYRDNKYVARVEVLTATSDKAIAKVVPGFKTTPLQKGDNVATRFKS
jgi:SMC interacting uncharacterized protein involved in chromosome segregation